MKKAAWILLLVVVVFTPLVVSFALQLDWGSENVGPQVEENMSPAIGPQVNFVDATLDAELKAEDCWSVESHFQDAHIVSCAITGPETRIIGTWVLLGDRSAPTDIWPGGDIAETFSAGENFRDTDHYTPDLAVEVDVLRTHVRDREMD